jgi:hypothetical protein
MNNSFSRFVEEKKKKKEKSENKNTQKKQKESKKKENKIVTDYSPTVIFVPIEPQQRPESKIIVEMKDVELYYCYLFFDNQIRAKVLESDPEYSKIKFKVKEKGIQRITKVPPVKEKNPALSERILSQTNKRLIIQKKSPIKIPSSQYEDEVIDSGSISPPISDLSASSCSSSHSSEEDVLAPCLSNPSSITQKRKRDSGGETQEENKRRKPNGGEQKQSIHSISHSEMEWDQY